MDLTLHDYQEVAKDFLLKTPKAGLFLDVGFGKTATTLATLIELASKHQISGHILIIAPKAIARSTWIDEMDKWDIKANIVSLIVDYDPERYERELSEWQEKVDFINAVKAIYPNPCDLKKNKNVTINGVKYPAGKFLKPKATETEAYYKPLPRRPSRDKELTKEKRLKLYDEIASHKASFYFINREMIPDLVNWHIENQKPWPFQTVVIDELQSFKSHKSERFRAMKKMSPYIKRFIGLTGTPVPNGLTDLWAEIYLMDNGQRLGKNITAYHTRFFNPGLVKDNQILTWNPKWDAEEAIYDLISDLVISVQNPNLKLPDVTYNNVYCHLSDEEMDMYKEFKKEQILELQSEHGDEIVIEASNAAVLCGKLSQMASGTLYLEDKKSYQVIHQRKLEQLEYIIENTTSPVLVAYHFKSDKEEITKYLESKGYKPQTLDGSPDMIHNWNDGKIPVMLIQPASCGHGINLQYGGHTLVWYTIPWSLEHYIQTCGRIARQGQPKPVVIHHLLTKGTIDSRILNAIEKKDTSEKALLEAISAEI